MCWTPPPIPPTPAPSQYANYLWDGSAWSLVSTQSSAKSDAASKPASISPSSNATTTELGYVSGGNRVTTVTVTVTTAFDGDIALSVGDASDHANIIANSLVDMARIGVYTTVPDTVYAANTQTDLFVYTTGAATIGAARVVISFE
jgi:Na+-transporting NADH:ubiquinone oxidoreductase subunit NqrB